MFGHAVGGDPVGAELVAGPRVDHVADRDDERLFPPEQAMRPLGKHGWRRDLHRTLRIFVITVR
jgi:hypothetical protein